MVAAGAHVDLQQEQYLAKDFSLINELIASIVPSARVALRVFVGHD